MESEKGESSQLRGETAEKRVVQVADGGWGWVVCVTAFCANGILFGIINTFGIIYTALCEEYKSLNDPLIAFKTCMLLQLDFFCVFSNLFQLYIHYRVPHAIKIIIMCVYVCVL
jgi:hypothetical protein